MGNLSGREKNFHRKQRGITKAKRLLHAARSPCLSRSRTRARRLAAGNNVATGLLKRPKVSPAAPSPTKHLGKGMLEMFHTWSVSLPAGSYFCGGKNQGLGGS